MSSGLTLHDKTAYAGHDQPGQPDPVDKLKRVLVIDDELIIAWLLEEGLGEMANCEVISTSSAREALQLLAASYFDLCIVDYKMPEMDGLTLARHMRQLQPQIKIVMLTAYGSEWLCEQAREIGFHDVLNKPVKLAEIRSLVLKLLHR